MSRTILNATRSSLAHSRLPFAFWDYSVLDATFSTFKYNHIPRSLTKHPPISLWKPNTTFPTLFLTLGTIGSIFDPSASKNIYHFFPALFYFSQTLVIATRKSFSSKQIETPSASMQNLKATIRDYIQPSSLFLSSNRITITSPDTFHIFQSTPVPQSIKKMTKYPYVAEYSIVHGQ